MRELPHCDDLFVKFFDPWYDDAARQRRDFKATFPDISQSDTLIGLTQEEASCVVEEGQQHILEQIKRMIDAVRHDWPRYLAVEGEIDSNWIDAFDRHYDRKRIHAVIERSDASNFGNDYMVLCCEFGAALSHVLRSTEPRLVWRLDWPYWDSSLLDPKTGTRISVFHWAIKKMSEYGVDDGFAAKTNACLRILSEQR
jgi:hypothetical protein